MRKYHNSVLGAALLTCAGCTTARAPAGVAATARQAMILATHPVLNAGDSTGLMSAFRHPSGRVSPDAVEFIVRTADGKLMSVVQSVEPGLRVGHPVVIQPGAQTRLVPAV